MSKPSPPTRFRFWLWLIRLTGVIVPRRLRAAWRQEWEAELRHREQMLAKWDHIDSRNKLRLLWRSLAACWDALLLQPRRLEDEMFQDLRFGVRMLQRHRGFTLATVLTLGLGVGATTTLFSVLDAVLFNSLPFAHADRLMQIDYPGFVYNTDTKTDIEFMTPVEPIDVFDHVAAYNYGRVNLTDDHMPERVGAMRVTARFFPMLGVAPMIGRVFTTGEEQPGRNQVAVIGYDLWQKHFGSDPNIVNKSVGINGRSFSVIGVMPREYRFTHYRAKTDLWVPLTPSDRLFELDAQFYEVAARLKPGTSQQQAQSQLNLIFDRVWAKDPANKEQYKEMSRSRLLPLQERFVGKLRSPLLILLGAVACVMLLACANTANLLLARASARQKELAIRAAVGASRLRLIRQWLTESMLLALLGGALGLFFAVWSVKALVLLNPFQVPLIRDVEINGRALLFTLAISLLSGWAFGLIPAWRASKPSINEFLKIGGQKDGGSLSPRLRNLLLLTEVALALFLLVGAGLLTRSFRNVLEVPPGFDPRQVLTLEVSPDRLGYPTAEQRADFYQNVLSILHSVPGVEQASLTNHLPIAPSVIWMIIPVQVEGRLTTPANFASGGYRIASTDYFRAMRIPLLAGRHFTEQDDAHGQPVVILNQSLARRIFPEEDPLGKRVTIFRETKTVYEIIGVIGDVKTTGLDATSFPEFYLPLPQKPPTFASLAIRSSIDPSHLGPAIRKAIWAVDPKQPVYNVITMEQLIAESLAQRRFSMFLLSIFAGIGLVLAVIGVYGVMAYSVTQRTHEIGVRMALGAQAGSILSMIIRQGMRVVIIGVLAGLTGAYFLMRVLKDLLFNVSATDPITFAAITVLLVAIALLACYLPARRAARLDPMIALRRE
jgi:putative ABC transport system permease protein